MDSDTYSYETDIAKYQIRIKKLNDNQIFDYIKIMNHITPLLHLGMKSQKICW